MSEILTGRRVVSYEVLERIYVGLLIPPGHMGMAYDLDTINLLGPSHPQWPARVRGARATVVEQPPKRVERGPDVYDTRRGEEGWSSHG